MRAPDRGRYALVRQGRLVSPNLPPWQEFLGAVAVGTLDDYRNEHASAVLFIDRGGRTFALTFGFGRHLLDARWSQGPIAAADR
jgi:uncharacterized protein (TIGR04141 family)